MCLRQFYALCHVFFSHFLSPDTWQTTTKLLSLMPLSCTVWGRLFSLLLDFSLVSLGLLYIPYLVTWLFNGTFCDIKSRILKVQQRQVTGLLRRWGKKGGAEPWSLFSCAAKRASEGKGFAWSTNSRHCRKKKKKELPFNYCYLYVGTWGAGISLHVFQSSFCSLRFVKWQVTRRQQVSNCVFVRSSDRFQRQFHVEMSIWSWFVRSRTICPAYLKHTVSLNPKKNEDGQHLG